MIAVLLPVKVFAHSKQRLAGVLGPSERESLARAMFDDTWDTLCRLRAQGAVERLLVATAEPYVMARCAGEGVAYLKEHDQISHSESVRNATGWAIRLGVKTLLSVAIDTPGATVEELSALLALAHRYSVIIVPSADGTGTNALLRTPADAIEPQFGPGSLRLHAVAAEAADTPYLIYRAAGLAADIDTPEDAESFLALDRPCRTANLLRELLLERRGVPPMPLTPSRASSLLDRAVEGQPLSRSETLELYLSEEVPLSQLAEAARELRRRAKGEVITYSPKVFLPLTNLCRDRCGYCTFRRDPDEPGAHWMEPEEVLEVARAGEHLGCYEALLSLGDRPEAAFPEAREWLRRHGFATTLQYTAAISELLLRETSLFPHTNPGLMGPADIARLRESNASLGLMLESTGLTLFAISGAHQFAVDKLPSRRLNTVREAGEQKVPFTTGILVGIGESAEDRVDSLLAIRGLQQRYGHIQEVIIQNFVPKLEIPMRHWPPPEPQAFARVVALARLTVGQEVNVQAPPNLSPQGLSLLLDCGINDWGGISPLTPDYINPEKPWPQVELLSELAASKDLRLRKRLPIYPEFVRRRHFFSQRVWEKLRACTDEQGYPLAEFSTGEMAKLPAATSHSYGD